MINLPLLKENFINDAKLNLKEINVVKIIESEIIADLIKASILDAFNSNTFNLRFRDFLDLDVNQYYFIEGWFHNSYHYNEVIDEIIQETLSSCLQDFTKYCISFNLHSDFLFSVLVNKFNDELILLQDLILFCNDLAKDSFHVSVSDLPIFSSNPPLSSFFPLFSHSIVLFKIASSFNPSSNINDFITRDSILFSDYQKG